MIADRLLNLKIESWLWSFHDLSDVQAANFSLKMTVLGKLCCLALLLIVVVLPCLSMVDLLYAFSLTQRQCSTLRH